MKTYGKIRLKRKRKNYRLFCFTLILTLAFLVSLVSCYYTSESLTPTLLTIAEAKLNKFSTLVVNNATSQILEDKIETDDLFSITKNSKGEIQLIDFDPVKVNHILNVATTVVQKNIRMLEDGNLSTIGFADLNLDEEEFAFLKEGIIISVPIGVATNVTLLSNLGPKIPIRLSYIGDVNSNVVTKLTQYGINNALVEISVRMEMTAQIYLPFRTVIKTLDCDIPIVIKMVQGTIPNFYTGSLTTSSSVYTKTLD